VLPPNKLSPVPKIMSIAAAPGWKARFADEVEPDGVRVVTLVAWALVERGAADPEIVGVIQRSPTGDRPAGWLGFADEVDGFSGYTYAG
jgi:hypothetical protein